MAVLTKIVAVPETGNMDVGLLIPAPRDFALCLLYDFIPVLYMMVSNGNVFLIAMTVFPDKKMKRRSSKMMRVALRMMRVA